MKRLSFAAASLLLVACFAACTSDPEAPPAPPAAQWTLELLATVDGLDAPECLLPTSGSQVVYVSNIETAADGHWTDDGKGFISLLTPDGKIIKPRWLDSTSAAPLNAPKGLAILGDYLYIADNKQLKRAALDTAGPAEAVPIPLGEKYNDVVTDGAAIYVSDTGKDAIYRVTPDGKYTPLKTPPSPNGLTFHGGKMYGVSWGEHDIYELDPSGQAAPKPLGVAKHFESLDGLAVLSDGTFIVSDFIAGRVCAVSADGKRVRTLAEGLDTPADLGLDEARGLLYVPTLVANKALVYKIEK